MSLPPLFSGARRRGLLSLLALAAGSAALSLALAVLLGAALGGGLSASLWETALALVGAAVVAVALRQAEIVAAERLGQSYVAETRVLLYRSLAARRRPPRHGPAMARFVNDLSALKNWVSLGAARLCVAPLSLTALLAGAAAIDLRLAAALTPPALAAAIAAMSLTGELRRRVRASRLERGRMAATLSERLRALPSLIAYGRFAETVEALARNSESLAACNVRRARVSALMRAATEAATPLSVLGLLLAAQAGAEREVLAAGALLVGVAATQTRDIARGLEHWAAYKEAARFLTRGPAPLAPQSPTTVSHRGAAPEPPPRLRARGGASRSLRPGARVAISGLSRRERDGLLGRRAWPSSTRLRLRGVAGAAAPGPADRRSAIRLVSPEQPLTSGALIDAVRLAPEATADGAGRALKAVGFTPDRWGAEIGELGTRLAPNEQARLRLARALAAAPQVIVVDDPALLEDAAGRAALERLEDFGCAAVLLLETDRSPPTGWRRLALPERGATGGFPPRSTSGATRETP